MNKYIKYIKYIKYLLLLLTLVSFIVFFNPGNTYKDFGSLSWGLLIGVMFIRPLKDIFPKCKIFSFLLKFRREFGILVGIFGIAHVVGFIKLMNYPSIFGVFTDNNTWNYKGLLFWGMLALLISIPLLITSNGISTKILGKNWKTLQRFAYAMFVLVAIHIYMIEGEIASIIIVTIWFILFSIAFFKNRKNKSIVSNGPKWLCVPCGYIYDENIGDVDSGILPGTRFEDIPADWLCPVCGVGKSDFILLETDVEVNEGKIVSFEYLTEDVVEMKVEIKKHLEYTSGQFLSFVLSDLNGEFNRSYSIANKEGNIYTFLIKLKLDGRAGIILKSKKVGDKINCTSISGNFKLQNTNNDKIFIATGTGLAPIYSMLLNTPEEINKKLYFQAAKQKDLFYEEKLKRIKNLELNIFLSREEVSGYNFGRFNLEKILVGNDTEIYICGNPAMANDAISFFENKGLSNNVYFERF